MEMFGYLITTTGISKANWNQRQPFKYNSMCASKKKTPSDPDF